MNTATRIVDTTGCVFRRAEEGAAKPFTAALRDNIL